MGCSDTVLRLLKLVRKQRLLRLVRKQRLLIFVSKQRHSDY